MSYGRNHFYKYRAAAVAFPMAVIFVLFVTGCVSNVGKGPITLSARTAAAFAHYQTFDDPGEFYVSEDGRYSYFTYCQEAQCIPTVPTKALCEKLSAGVPCYIYAQSGRVVWKF